MEEPKRKHGKLGAGGAEQKRAQNREIEKWMRFHEPVTMPVSQVKGDKDRMKAEAKSRVPNSLGQGEKDKKGSLVSPQSGGDVKEEERSLGGSTDKGPRLPQSTQDALVSRTNPRSILTGLPSTTSHS
ncbi:uncharacterized protein LOC109850936 [Asparagus officinalis]|nr:uncharacterized protein LOC109850936 [Asparagus officinalis]